MDKTLLQTKIDKLISELNDLAETMNEDKIVISIWQSLLSFFRKELEKDVEKNGKATDYTHGIIAAINELERLYPCIENWKSQFGDN